MLNNWNQLWVAKIVEYFMFLQYLSSLFDSKGKHRFLSSKIPWGDLI